LYSGLEVLSRNINRRQTDLKYFEFGTVYSKAESGYAESRRLAIFLSGKKTAESWLEPAKSFGFSDLYASVENILLTLNVDLGEVSMVEEAPFEYALQLKLGGG
jgi:phenylalanyl-tRNA synthetase beta chain